MTATTSIARGDSLAHFRSMPAEHQDLLGWRVARGNLLPAPFWPGGQLRRKPQPDGSGGVVYYKVAAEGTLGEQDETPTTLPTGDLHDRAARFLRHTCTMYRVDPPSVADIMEWASVAFDVTEDHVNSQDWLDDFIDARERVAGERCQAVFGMLDRFARLDDATAQTVADLSEDARFASPCDPQVLVMVTADGGAIVADLAGRNVHEFDPRPRRRSPWAFLADLWRIG